MTRGTAARAKQTQRDALGGCRRLDTTLSTIATEAHEADVLSAAIARLTEINLDDLVSSFGWQDRPLPSTVMRTLLRNAARTFARQIVEFDTAVGRADLVGASGHALSHYVRSVHVFGRERIPAGAFLAVANHPGMTDALSLFSALNRPDLRVLALRRPFLQALPHTAKRLSCLSDEPHANAAVVRKVSAHLRAGGAALSFPAGHIEPDPDNADGAIESLQSWMQSAGAFVRLAPETAILPVLVRGVVWPKAASNWLRRSKGATAAQRKAAAALQLLAHIVLNVKPVRVRVQIGRPIYARDLGTAKAGAIHQAVLAEMSTLIRNLPETEGKQLVGLKAAVRVCSN